MPQFDTYSFFSQIFWVLFFFIILYLTLTYYLLPAIAITLKVRKRKLSIQGSTAQSSALTGSSFGFNNQFQLISALTVSEFTNCKSRFEKIKPVGLGVSSKSVIDFLLTNECNKMFLSNFSACFFSVSLYAKK